MNYKTILKRLIPLVRRAERFLGPEDDWVEDDRRIVYEAVHPLTTALLDRPAIREKGVKDYVTTAHADSDVIERVLSRGGYQRNLLSTRKYRTHHGGGRQYAVGSWVLDADDTDWQHHVYLFPAPNGGTDVYAHREPSVRNPKAHENGWRRFGDPNGRVRGLITDAGIEHGQRDFHKT